MEYVKNDGFVFAGLDGVFDEKQGNRSRIKKHAHS